MKSPRRVVVTGLGAVTPLGLNVADTWQKILAGESGVREAEHLVDAGTATQFAALVQGFDSAAYLDPKEAKRYAKFIHFGVAAAQEAVADAGIEISEGIAARTGVAVASGIGGLEWIEKNSQALVKGGPRKISPFFIPGSIINMASGLLAIRHNCRGPNITIVTACTTGTHNIGVSARLIAYGDADVMLAGGTESTTSPLGVGGFNAMRALSTRNESPETASRPFDVSRDGFVMGEGAGILVLEEYEHAKARGAKIYAELTGFGMSDDAYHITLTDPEATGAYQSMKNAVEDAGLSPGDIDYINAHGTSTQANEKTETAGIRRLFGDDTKVAISSTKSMTGHLLGAAGAVEAIFSILAIRDQVAPPTINLTEVDPICGNLDFVPNKAREMAIDTVLSNSFGFGGTNGSLVFKRYSSQ